MSFFPPRSGQIRMDGTLTPDPASSQRYQTAEATKARIPVSRDCDKNPSSLFLIYFPLYKYILLRLIIMTDQVLF